MGTNATTAKLRHQLEEIARRERMEHPIYANNRSTALQRALHRTFQLVATEMGDEIFLPLASAYVEFQASENWDINLYGDAFPHFVFVQSQGQRAYLHNWVEYAWVAELEYRLLRLYYADDDTANLMTSWRMAFEVGALRGRTLLQKLPAIHPWVEYIDHQPPLDTPPCAYVLIAQRELSDKGFSMSVEILSDQPETSPELASLL